MPILAKECDLFPESLLEDSAFPAGTESGWWALYTLSRREKNSCAACAAKGSPITAR
jgi:hypothetical protein